MQFYASADFDLPLPDGHRFPGHKYGMLRRKLLGDGTIAPNALLHSPRAKREDLLRAHAASYVDALTDGSIDPKIMRRIGFPWSPQIPIRAERTVGGALAAASSAIQEGLSGQLAGGTHHAHQDQGAGFCVYNDFAVVALTLLLADRADRIAIIDLDVHQGDGNASILQGQEGIFIMDVFCEKNFPFRKVPSTHDVPIEDAAGDDVYLRTLAEHLPAIWSYRPDIILYQAGVDGLDADRLGRLTLTYEGLMERDRMVLGGAFARGIPVSMAIGGGYAEPIDATVTAYANTYDVAKSIYKF